MSKVEIQWKNEVPEKAKIILKNAIKGLWDASEEAVDIIGNKSNEQVPFDVGTLSDSWYVRPLTSKIGFAMGYTEPYAARLHEHPEYKFQNGRKAKYLEQPIEENLGDWKGNFLAKLREVII